MGIPELRSELHDFINHADERFLKMVYAMSKEYGSPEVVGYNTDGSSLTQQDLVKRVKSASKRVKSGGFLTQEDVEKEVDDW